MTVENGKIEEFINYGDYFGNGDVTDICKRIIGRKLIEDEIKEAISDIIISNYYNNLKDEDFISLLVY